MFTGLNEFEDLQLFNELEQTLNLPFITSYLVCNQNIYHAWQGNKISDLYKNIHLAYGATKPCLYLIRPDKYVGFRGKLENVEKIKTYSKHYL